ncbi:oligopeptide transporter subunit; ATP-binding component of ABC superfamily [Desulfamplus magnetovallimortis]|uniref:Oligopeptide transporter subunit ATP-binding component of ABC superfamily n=1 Tax=Desulfamplus magnetovallimortis TaxID=1246637 RepID=A0A1W1HI87_9BACT|nr:oligopeptide/dipeptide ABC transporter ATP-binding protein [Desulfamplus magnetovallimortis]SLM32221.1 oligopeptide transporter subunit; ATP-binding component of ABC superfamily [Desulfamplus magnetovallimortis]
MTKNMNSQNNTEKVLSVRGLKVYFPVKKGIFKKTVGHVKAVDGVSFDIYRGKTLGLVGESGCGKTTVAKAIVKLVHAHEGEVICKGTDLLTAKPSKLRELRKHIQMIFQDPFSSLDPKMTVGNIIGEAVKFHRPDEDTEKLVLNYMEITGLRGEYYKRYPHEFSGGQRQRIGIARALATEPSIVVADEPVYALDVSVQAKALNLMKNLQQRLDLSYLFITHDLSVVKHISHQIAVMYLGSIVEIFNSKDLKNKTVHPYTRALISSIPSSTPGQKREEIILQGEIPSPMNAPPGCKFQTRCQYKTSICEKVKPELEPINSSSISSAQKSPLGASNLPPVQSHNSVSTMPNRNKHLQGNIPASELTHLVACHNWRSLPFNIDNLHFNIDKKAGNIAP